MATRAPYDIFFTGKDDPRDGCVMIGYLGEDHRPIYFHFETLELNAGSDVRTTLYRNGGEIIAYFEWALGCHLGTASVGGKQIPMSYFVMRGTTVGARAFTTPNGSQCYEWRKVDTDQAKGYDLYTRDTRMAVFRYQSRMTPVGPSYALLQCAFDDEALLAEAALALCLNRWMDWRGIGL